MEIYVCWHMCWTDSIGRSIKTAHKFKFLAGHCVTILHHRQPSFQNHNLAHRNNKQEWEFIFIELQSNLSPCVHWLKIAFWLVYVNNFSLSPHLNQIYKKLLSVELIGTMRMISPKLEGVGLLPGCSVYLPRTVRNTRYTFSPTDLGYSTMHWSIQIDVNVYRNVMWCAHTYAFCSHNMAEQCNLLHLSADKT